MKPEYYTVFTHATEEQAAKAVARWVKDKNDYIDLCRNEKIPELLYPFCNN